MKPFVLILLVIATFELKAQVDFSGSWLCKEVKGIFGPHNSIALPVKMEVEQNSDSIIIYSVSIGENGVEYTRSYSVAMNGRVAPFISPTQRKGKSWLSWSKDKKQLIITSVYFELRNESEVDFRRVDVWKIKDGDLLFHRKSTETRSENWEVKGVFKRSK